MESFGPSRAQGRLAELLAGSPNPSMINSGRQDGAAVNPDLYSRPREPGQPTIVHSKGAQPGSAGIYEPIEKIHFPFTGKQGTCITLILFAATFKKLKRTG